MQSCFVSISRSPVWYAEQNTVAIFTIWHAAGLLPYDASNEEPTPQYYVHRGWLLLIARVHCTQKLGKMPRDSGQSLENPHRQDFKNR